MPRTFPIFTPNGHMIPMTSPRTVLSASLIAFAALSTAACGGGDEVRRADLGASNVTNIGVNGYLWRASLEALSFMPMAQVDSQGGVIVTDWYQNPQAPEERIKVTVYILSQDLRADGVRVAAARQQRSGNGWADVEVRAGTVQKLEETILTRARDLRRSATVTG